MDAASLRNHLAENQAEIFSRISCAGEDTPQLCALQEAAFSSLLSVLGGGDFRPVAVRIRNAARNAAAHHSLAQQIAALDQLESAILRFFPSDAGVAARELIRLANFFCEVRRLAVSAYSLASAGSPPAEGPSPDDKRARVRARLRSVKLFDEVMHQLLNPSTEPDQVMEMICRGALQMTTADAVALYMVCQTTGDFVMKQFLTGAPLRKIEQELLPEFLHHFERIPRDSTRARGLFEVALAEKRPIFGADVANDPRVHKGKELSGLGIEAMLVVPMFALDKELGFMAVALASSQTLTSEEVESLSLFADLAAVAWRNAELYSQLRRSEQRYRDLIENAIDIIFVLNTEGRFVSINRRAEQVIGYSAKDWLGRHFSEILNPEGLAMAMESWARGLSGGTDFLNVKIKKANGEDLYLQINNSLIEEEGKLTGMMCIARDITGETRREAESKKLHESVVETNRKLEESVARLKATQAKLVQTEKLSAMGELISGIAHELNNPLTGIMGYSQLLLETAADPQLREDLEKINREALRCKRIVQNLLGFARGHKPQRRVTDINSVIRSVIDLREYQINSDGIRVVTRLNEAQPQTVGDFHQLQQLILNILNNAHQAMVHAGKGERIEVSTERDKAGSCARIRVADDGPGIEPETMPKIFDPFFTTRDVGEGTGLGLSVAYGIVKEHGGAISVESTPGEGATFQIELPLPERRENALDDSSASPESRHSAQKRRILLVDDEEVILDLLTDILLQMDMVAEKARNGHEALEKIRAAEFEGIICDLKMPGMDGKTLYHKIQEVNPELSRRMIFSTGDTLSEDFVAFCEATECKVVEKPFLIEDIKDALECITHA